MNQILYVLILVLFTTFNIVNAQRIAATINNEDCLELFYCNNSHELCYRYQPEPGTDWSGEEIVTGLVQKVFLGKGPDGSLELFYIDTDNDLYHAKKFPSDDVWPAAGLLREGVNSITLIRNSEGYLRLFCILEDNSVKYREQTTFAGLWSDEEDFIPYANILAAGYNADGRLEVFYTIASDVFMHKWQLSPDGDWADAAVFSDPARAVTVATNADGRLEVFFIGTDDQLHHKWQTAPGSGWDDDAVFAGEAHLVRLEQNLDGRLEIIYTDADDILYHNWQTAPSNGWGAEQQFGWYAADLVIAKNHDQQLEAVYLGDDGLLYHRYQLEPGMFWSSEYPFISERDYPFSFEEYNTMPSFSNDPDWHINDHCFIESDEGEWHVFGIMYPDPGSGDMSYVNYFGHASADHLYDIPWTEETPPFYESFSEGDVLWAPHIVHYEGIYYMFYCGGGEDTHFKICLRTSDDLINWSAEQILFQDGYQARDPMVIYVNEIEKWVMYYCATETPDGGNFVVLCKTSEDLINWSGRQIVYRDLHTGTGYGPTESPFVVKRGDYYYLFIGPRPYDHPTETLPNWEHPGYCGTDVFRSTNWNNWTNADFVGWFDAHAPEIVIDRNGQWYASHCGVLQGGLYIRKMFWNDGITSINNITAKSENTYLMLNVLPNPFRDITEIQYILKEAGYVQIDIMDLTGKKIKNLVYENLSPGEYLKTWNGTNSTGDMVPRGMYLCRLVTGNTVATKKIMRNR